MLFLEPQQTWLPLAVCGCSPGNEACSLQSDHVILFYYAHNFGFHQSLNICRWDPHFPVPQLACCLYHSALPLACIACLLFTEIGWLLLPLRLLFIHVLLPLSAIVISSLLSPVRLERPIYKHKVNGPLEESILAWTIMRVAVAVIPCPCYNCC